MENQADIIEAFISTSRYLDDLSNIDNVHFEQIVDRIYPAELQLNKANSSDNEAPFFGSEFIIPVSNGTVSTKVYDKRVDFDIVIFPFLDGDLGVLSQLIRFARASSHVTEFSCRNKVLNAKLLKQGYRYHKLRKAFPKFYRRHSGLVGKYNVILKKFMQQGISEPEFYGDLFYRIRINVGNQIFRNNSESLLTVIKE